MRKTFIFFIRIYQSAVSPLLGSHCRFYPSCSSFMAEAVEKHGLRGFFIGIKRLMKCHPFNKGGFDPLEKWIN
ncbi:MAG TPA: membrane protein insertion efficiency factor YidD [bacterium]|nr:membrane protein insertion efficiency factor YidD [bacterium]